MDNRIEAAASGAVSYIKSLFDSYEASASDPYTIKVGEPIDFLGLAAAALSAADAASMSEEDAVLFTAMQSAIEVSESMSGVTMDNHRRLLALARRGAAASVVPWGHIAIPRKMTVEMYAALRGVSRGSYAAFLAKFSVPLPTEGEIRASERERIATLAEKNGLVVTAELIREASESPTDTQVPFISAFKRFAIGDRVYKRKGSSWHGIVCGYYSTKLTPIGYAVESEREPGSVQIYPEAALEYADGGGDQ